MSKNSQIVQKMTGLLYPFLILFGIYIIANGHITPGGGFQGGAILASVFISRYLVHPFEDMEINYFLVFEKIFFFLIVIIPALFVFTGFSQRADSYNLFYLMAMNALIGLKVCCGLTVIFFRFIFYEGSNE